MADKPITRKELYMAKSGGQDVKVPEPITREEYFLAKIAGEDVKVPEPITRAERFLAAIIENGGGGGGGLEYETGSWKPAEDVARGNIAFKDTHTGPPSFIVLKDETGVDDYTTSTNWSFVWIDYTNVPISWSSTAVRYGYAHYLYRTSSTSLSSSGTGANIPYSNTLDTTVNYYRYWVTESGFKPFSNSDSRYWRAGRTYNWIAVWL